MNDEPIVFIKDIQQLREFLKLTDKRHYKQQTYWSFAKRKVVA